MTTLEGHTSREIRGRILKILKLNYPQQTGDRLIADILIDAQYQTMPAAVETHLIYLREKGGSGVPGCIAQTGETSAEGD